MTRVTRRLIAIYVIRYSSGHLHLFRPFVLLLALSKHVIVIMSTPPAFVETPGLPKVAGFKQHVVRSGANSGLTINL